MNGHPKKGSSFIAENIIIHGNINGEGDVRMSGSLKGEVRLNAGCFVVEESGYIEGDISVPDLTISGRVNGTINSENRVEITSTGKVEGSIKTPRLQIAEGAVLNGDFEVKREEE